MKSDDDSFELLLLPGERVVYKTRRGFGKLPLASWLIATNKRFLMANKLGFITNYKSIFYNSISQVTVHNSILGSKLHIAVNGVKANANIRFVRKLQALSIFSILSNQVSIKNELPNIYGNNTEFSSIPQKNATYGKMTEVVEQIEANSVVFAEMLKRVELNETNQKLALKKFIRKGKANEEGQLNNYEIPIEEKSRQNKLYIDSTAINRYINTQMQHIKNRLNNVHNLHISNLSKLTEFTRPRESTTELLNAQNAPRYNQEIPKRGSKTSSLNPDKDLIIFLKRSIEGRILKDYNKSKEKD
ncbi:MAG: PH domain-containing protein [Candidatus Micrarchaeia archaeon]